eukprot:CAMPEP_0179103400 /NCGR_PEP_ID=MMETSP0796-20121207/47911_1 /TAXON_ID=73915 /ORGANISM="Pyrodinium bahamense, Strain pbaha01" /LENGTH=334 /DNA_ID=CAMNT_0020801311 /DNA_START=53 /DNA_END=1058 /DNA_ORIENTATION=+
MSVQGSDRGQTNNRSNSNSCCTYSDLWNLPSGTIVAFVLTHVGFLLCGLNRGRVLRALEGIGSGAEIIRQCVRIIYLPLVFTSVVGLCCLAVSCTLGVSLGRRSGFKSGAIPEEDAGLCLPCRQRLASPRLVGALEMLTKITFLFQLVLSYMLFIPYVSSDILAAICSGGPQVLQEAHDLNAALRSSSDGGHSFTAGLDMARYCAAAEGLGSSALVFFIGMGLTVLGQAGLMSCMAELMDIACQAVGLDKDGIISSPCSTPRGSGTSRGEEAGDFTLDSTPVRPSDQAPAHLQLPDQGAAPRVPSVPLSTTSAASESVSSIKALHVSSTSIAAP